MFKSRTVGFKANLFLGAASLAAFAVPATVAHAQQTAAAEAPETVIVTGSRIPQRGIEGDNVSLAQIGPSPLSTNLFINCGNPLMSAQERQTIFGTTVTAGTPQAQCASIAPTSPIYASAANGNTAATTSIRAAYRFSSYDRAGDTNTYRVGMQWAPNDDFKLRGSYDRAVRAPNVAELFTPQGGSASSSGIDPCSALTANTGITTTAALCNATGVPAARALCAWLRQMDGVKELQSEWYPDSMPGQGGGTTQRHGNIKPEHMQRVIIQQRAGRLESLTVTA